MSGLWQRLAPRGGEQIVPATGPSARLTLATAAAMAFLAVFALALALAAGQLADRWSGALAGAATIRISAPEGQGAAQTEAALRVLAETPGIRSARALPKAEVEALLAPWFGLELSAADLPLPQVIALEMEGEGPDAEGLRLRLQGEAPGAVYDDHARFRAPLMAAAARLRALGFLALALIGGVTAAVITLAVHAAMAANRPVIAVLRLVGAKDRFIARAFVQRLTGRAALGAALGTGLGLIALWLMPQAAPEGGLLAGLGLSGRAFLWPLLFVPLAALIALLATARAAQRHLRDLP